MQKRSNAAKQRQNVVQMEDLRRTRPERGAEGRATRTRRASEQWEEEEYERTPHAKPARRRSFGLLWFLVMLLLLAAMVVVSLGVFRVNAVTVTGNKATGSDEIVSLSGIRVGENIFQANLSRAKGGIEKDPLLEVRGIKRVLPDKITIDIRERSPHGALRYLGVYAVIDEYGYVLDQRSDLPAGQYPLITGIETEPPVTGKKLKAVDTTQFAALCDLLTALDKGGATGDIADINLSDSQNLKLMTQEGLAIVLGKPTDLERKVQWIASSVPELRDQGYTTGTLYITGTGDPVYSKETEQVAPDGESATQPEEQPGDQPANPDDSDNGGQPTDGGQNDDEQNSNEQNNSSGQAGDANA